MTIETYLAVLSLIVIGTILSIAGLYWWTLFLLKKAPELQRRMMAEMMSDLDAPDFNSHVETTPGMTSPYH